MDRGTNVDSVGGNGGPVPDVPAGDRVTGLERLVECAEAAKWLIRARQDPDVDEIGAWIRLTQAVCALEGK